MAILTSLCSLTTEMVKYITADHRCKPVECTPNGEEEFGRPALR